MAESESTYAKSIELTEDEAFFNLSNAISFAIDIGGTLTKIAYSVKLKRRTASISEDATATSAIYSAEERDEDGVRVHFVKFENKYMDQCLEFIQKSLLSSRPPGMQKPHVKVTGGGAHKFRDSIQDKLNVVLEKEPELDCVIAGCCFLLRHIRDELFSYAAKESPQYCFQPTAPPFPFVLVNIGSGVSVVKVEAEDSFTRIGGSSLGGGTFLGLGCMLTEAESFDELMRLAAKGDHRRVDMLVSDIYGGSCDTLGLPAEIIASSFGKAARSSATAFSKEDLAKSMVITCSNNIGQVACLYAELHNVTRVIFGGFFIRGDPMIMHTLSYAVNFWSKGTIQTLFMRHEGYLGAVGAFLSGAQAHNAADYCWQENYAKSSGLHSSDEFSEAAKSKLTFDRLALDRSELMSVCPLLTDPSSYVPDAVDLSQDSAAREYWLQCFLDSSQKFAERARNSQPEAADAEKRAEEFRCRYVTRLQSLRENPCAYGSLTVRSLLDTREHYLVEQHFADPFLQQKRDENIAALQELPALLAELDSLEPEERLEQACRCLLAGNVFDWGAQHVAQLLEKGRMNFLAARAALQPRPWLADDLDKFKQRVLGSRPYRCVTLFCDNSGADIVLGVTTFCRELLRFGAKVILAANARPALNDVTAEELTVLIKRVACHCDIISDALRDGRLLIHSNAQGSPCLDLRTLDGALCSAMRETDLVVLEGMGRAVHTNAQVSLTCDLLSAALLKNKWLAERLGGEMFSVIFRLTSVSESTEIVTPDGQSCSVENN